MRRTKLRLWLIAVAGLGYCGSASAAVVTFGMPRAIRHIPPPVRRVTRFGVQVGGPAVTVNTVNFSAFNYGSGLATQTVRNTTISTASGTITNPGLADGMPSSATISNNYKSILDAGVYQDSTPATAFTISFGNLVQGQQYAFQFWVNDSRGPAAGGLRTETLSGPTGSTSVTLDRRPERFQWCRAIRHRHFYSRQHLNSDD